MKKLLAIQLTSLCAVLTGCASQTPLSLPDDWRAANKFDETPRVIALFRPYAYQVLSVDRTLMQLTRRWAKDTQIGFDYACDDDFSLPAKLEGETFRSVDAAMASINEVYKTFGVTLAINAQNKFTTRCINRDVVTGIARLDREDKPATPAASSTPLQIQSPPKVASKIVPKVAP
jgi:predicted small lipoprotein YifL